MTLGHYHSNYNIYRSGQVISWHDLIPVKDVNTTNATMYTLHCKHKNNKKQSAKFVSFNQNDKSAHVCSFTLLTRCCKYFTGSAIQQLEQSQQVSANPSDH